MLTGSCHCGKAGWALKGDPGAVTACNCTACRRYGGLWAYGFEGEHVAIIGETRSYIRADVAEPHLERLFCPTCACVLGWRGLHSREDGRREGGRREDGRRRMAVNVRLAPPGEVEHLPIDHFDGLDTFEDLPSKGLCVRDLWF